MSAPFTIFLHSCGYDRIYQAVNMLLAASSMGRPCHLFLFYQALAAYAADEWDKTIVSGGENTGEGGTPWDEEVTGAFELSNTPSLYGILETARNESGGVSVYACSASIQLLGLDPSEIKTKVDGIVGLATMLELSSHDGLVLYV
jgi:peroxiredoxin family protein